jgi:predicted nucleic acid-binding protein
MRILLDTNIIIPLENQALLQEPLAVLHALLTKNDVQILVHPASLRDIENDKDTQRRDIQISKIKKYSMLEASPQLDRLLFDSAGITIADSHDEIDCTILTALIKDAVHFLVTEDRGLHANARKLKLSDRVFKIEEAYSYFSAAFGRHSIELPNLELVYVHQIRDELKNPIFDSLRADYPSFDEWFIKCCQDGRQSWIARDSNGELGAVCIFKEELDPQITPQQKLHGRTLKLCTLKVEKNVRGQKLGEQLLKAGFRHATTNFCESVWITTKAHQVSLIEMLIDFGFVENGTNDQGDLVYVKQHPKMPPFISFEPVDYHIKYSPHFQGGAQIGKFIVPIKPPYHEQLFPDINDQQLRLPVINRPLPGNAIKQAYLCNSNTNQIKSGDVLLFYRSQDTHLCTTIGIVESADRLADPDIILEKVLKRTVYTKEEVYEICKKGALVILFRLQGHFPAPVSNKQLKDFGIIGPIQTIRRINHQQFQIIAKRGRFENSILTS